MLGSLLIEISQMAMGIPIIVALAQRTTVIPWLTSVSTAACLAVMTAGLLLIGQFPAAVICGINTILWLMMAVWRHGPA